MKGVWRWGKRESIYLSLHCHHQNDSCIKMGSDESHFNVSLIVRDKVTRQCPQTTTFEEKESRSGIEPGSRRLPAYRLTARPNRLSIREAKVRPVKNQLCWPRFIIMYIYHAFINALSAHIPDILYTCYTCCNDEHSPTKTIYIKYCTKNNNNALRTHTHEYYVREVNVLQPGPGLHLRRWPRVLTGGVISPYV